MCRRIFRTLFIFWLIPVLCILLSALDGRAAVITGYVRDRGGNPLNGAIVEYWRQECRCFPGQCGTGAPLIDYTGPTPYGHLSGQFYTINVPPGTFNVKVTYQGVPYNDALVNIPVTTCDNNQVRGPYTITLPIGGSACPYQSLQARVQASESDPWSPAITIALGQSARVATFRDGSGQLTECCVTMGFSGPGLDSSVSNLQTVTPPQGGTYILRSTCGDRSDSATVNVADAPPGPNPGFGLNPNNLIDPNRVAPVVNHFVNLGAGWVRLEIIRSQPPSYWSGVVDQFVNQGINVLALLSNQTWPGEARDPSSCGSGERRPPTAFGNRLATQFLNAADPYVQALKDRVSAWELWNEGNDSTTWLCPENYAFLLVEARLRWPDIGSIGPSLLSVGLGGSFVGDAATYLDNLKNRTEKALFWQESYGDVPWDFLLHHPYPGGQIPENFIPTQGSRLYAVQSKPIWFTEIGWFGAGSEEPVQADMLARAYNVALGGGWAEVMFWFSLYDCVPSYGLIADCGNPNGRQRQAYGIYRSLAGGG